MLLSPSPPTSRSPSRSARCIGVTSILFMTASTAIVQLRSDPMMRGRVLALQAIVFLGSTPIGGPIVGRLCEPFGARYGLALGAIATLGAGAYGLVVLRRDAVPADRPTGGGGARGAC